MKKLYDKLWEVIPTVWGFLWLVIITVGSLALAGWTIKWLLMLLGVLV